MPTPSSIEALRARLIAAAADAYEDAGFAGLCAEGRWERALDAMQALDLGAPGERPGGSPTDAAPFDGGAPPPPPPSGP